MLADVLSSDLLTLEKTLCSFAGEVFYSETTLLGILVWFLQLLQCLGDNTITLQLSYISRDLCSSHGAQESWLVSRGDLSKYNEVNTRSKL